MAERPAILIADVEILFPHHTIYTGLESRPFPVQIVDKKIT